MEKLDSHAALLENQTEQIGKMKKLNKETVKKTEEMCYGVQTRLAYLEGAWWNNSNEGEFYRNEGASLPNAVENSGGSGRGDEHHCSKAGGAHTEA